MSIPPWRIDPFHNGWVTFKKGETPSRTTGWLITVVPQLGLGPYWTSTEVIRAMRNRPHYQGKLYFHMHHTFCCPT